MVQASPVASSVWPIKASPASREIGVLCAHGDGVPAGLSTISQLTLL